MVTTRVLLGGPPIFLEFYVPLPNPFYCISKKEFSEIWEIWSLMSGIFLKSCPKAPKTFRNFVNIFKIEIKTIILLFKLVRNQYIDENLAKFCH